LGLYEIRVCISPGGANCYSAYRDFYFIAVVAAVLGLTTTLVHIFKWNDDLADWAKAVFGVLSFLFIIMAIESVGRFRELTGLKATELPLDDLAIDISIIYITLIAGLIAEVAVVLREHAP
jgi:hypothetical protein